LIYKQTQNINPFQ